MQAMSQSSSSWPHSALEISAVAAALLYFGILAWGLAACLSAGSWIFMALLCAAIGYLAADFASGFVHWMGDRLGSEAMPVLGPNFVAPFRYHHVDPKSITRHGFFVTNGNNCIVLAPVMIAVNRLFLPIPGDLVAVGVYAFTLFFGMAIFATNQFHKWAHTDDPPALVGLLQRWGLILGPEHHQIHHHTPYVTHFCITTGWLNVPLARLRFFERLEALLWTVFRVRAGEDDARVTQINQRAG